MIYTIHSYSSFDGYTTKKRKRQYIKYHVTDGADSGAIM